MTDTPDNVVHLKTAPTHQEQIRSEVVEVLKSMLTLAEAGDLTSLVLVAKRTNGNWLTGRTGTLNMPEAVGMLEVFKQKWIAEFEDEHE